MIEALRGEVVLGSPLGPPDFDDRLNYPEGWKAIGWHRSVADDWRAASSDADRLRVVIDQVASLTDLTAVEWHTRLTAR